MKMISRCAAGALFAATAVAAVAVLAETGALTRDYLSGEWCLAYMEVQGEREPENKRYVFSKDGTFQYQVSSTGSKLGEGKYEILDRKLRMKPIYITDLQVLSVEPNELVVKFFGDLHFVRGSCK